MLRGVILFGLLGAVPLLSGGCSGGPTGRDTPSAERDRKGGDSTPPAADGKDAKLKSVTIAVTGMT